MQALPHPIIEFDLPSSLACPKPTEKRNLSRDAVRLLVTTGSGQVIHTTFSKIDQYLQSGDVLVVNTSETVPSALAITLPDGRQGVVHLSTKVNDHEWLVEIREVRENKTFRWKEGEMGMVFTLPEGGKIIIQERFYKNRELLHLWQAHIQMEQPWEAYLRANARPIQYDRLDQSYPLDYYQTFFAFHPGSSEMPSAGRGFTLALIEKLLKKGVVFAPILLHTGVSSLEENETPYPEYMEVTPLSAAIINSAKSQDRRIIAVGTTAIRAVESAADSSGQVQPYRGNTSLYIEESYAMKVVDGLLTGFHEPRASHLHMLQSLAGWKHIERAYRAALKEGYYWHQFGDLHLLLP